MNKKVMTEVVLSWSARMVAVAVSSVLVTACNQNPIPIDQRMRPTTVEVPAGPQDVGQIFGFSFNERQQITLKEGEKVEFGFQVNVPAPGKPIVEVPMSGLPAGMVFDAKQLMFTWTPGFEAGNDSANPDSPNTFKDYEIPVRLRSSATGPSSIVRTLVFHVVDVRRALSISFEKSDAEVTEGQTFTQVISIESEDFPKGPFTLTAKGLPDTARFSPVVGSPNKFEMSFDTLPWDCTQGRSKKANTEPGCVYSVTYTATANQLAVVNAKQDLVIYDRRVAPTITGPTTVEMAPDISFSLAAVDPNYEVAPDMRVSAPPFGQIIVNTGREVFSIDSKKKSSRKPIKVKSPLPELQTVATVQWLGIPADQIGTQQELTFESCVHRDDFVGAEWLACGKQTVVVTIGAPRFKAPTIDRSDWVFGSLRYLKEGEQLRIQAYPRATDDAGDPMVQVESATDADEVSYDSASFLITIDAKKPGMKSFKLVASSPLSGTIRTEEAFTYEVLPKTWSNTLMFVDGIRDAESKKAQEIFDSVQLINPLLQRLDERMLSRRETLVLGTVALSDPEFLAQFELAAARVKNIVILTPLLDSLPASIMSEWKVMGVGTQGRLNSDPLTPEPQLKDLLVVRDVNATIPEAKDPVTLAGMATKESAAPALLRPASAKYCQPLLNLETKSGKYSKSAVITCNRPTGGKMVISGFEWADLVMLGADQALLKQWMSQALTP